ncbi:hypothetical protein AVEN_148604-1 [Araneus ventricosus]|uniref:Uncharacterized protein n=1 Tax=Araneus ventricosus TaxID=182803 RepID=A0A4Y2PMX1_ARAVE|nr:hypothetical protein AVEN_148604-1 [Araneus ventricosus]
MGNEFFKESNHEAQMQQARTSNSSPTPKEQNSKESLNSKHDPSRYLHLQFICAASVYSLSDGRDVTWNLLRNLDLALEKISESRYFEYLLLS